jgi:hypothetical protein
LKNRVQHQSLSHFNLLSRAVDLFYGVEDNDVQNVEIMTTASQFTTFTRYTAAPSTASRATTSKRSSRSKRKIERKVGSGRKGTIDEEEYLLKSLTKLVARFGTMQGEMLFKVYFIVTKKDCRRGV